ncbi:hypothetical protein PR048_032817 [Dryococelus australis]|uniref:Uncharacterized protein n=1 Tax=Dryococelus australis TaxID=614101 RepID=A0ABQ9G3A9_9NEOP|nr:hypothetical protein PR048_032817 [Dryococelus australis]
MGYTRENPLTSGIVWQDYYVRKFGGISADKFTRFALVGCEYSNHCTTAAPEPNDLGSYLKRTCPPEGGDAALPWTTRTSAPSHVQLCVSLTTGISETMLHDRHTRARPCLVAVDTQIHWLGDQHKLQYSWLVLCPVLWGVEGDVVHAAIVGGRHTNPLGAWRHEHGEVGLEVVGRLLVQLVGLAVDDDGGVVAILRRRILKRHRASLQVHHHVPVGPSTHPIAECLQPELNN